MPSRPIRAVPTFWISMPPLAFRARDFGVLKACVVVAARTAVSKRAMALVGAIYKPVAVPLGQ